MVEKITQIDAQIPEDHGAHKGAVLLVYDPNTREFYPLAGDGVSGGVVTVDVAHAHIHEGEHYEANDYDDDVDIATPKWWLVYAAASGYSHLLPFAYATANGLFEIFEGVEVSASGNQITPFNNNRNSSNTPNTEVYADPTITASGVRLTVAIIGTDKGPAKAGGVSRESEIVLKSDTLYGFKFTAGSDNTGVTIGLAWYE